VADRYHFPESDKIRRTRFERSNATKKIENELTTLQEA
jgi:hypothetical protein